MRYIIEIPVIYKIAEELGYDFFAMYACVGLWCQLFLILYASTDMCSLMKLATRFAFTQSKNFIAYSKLNLNLKSIWQTYTDKK